MTRIFLNFLNFAIDFSQKWKDDIQRKKLFVLMPKENLLLSADINVYQKYFRVFNQMPV